MGERSVESANRILRYWLEELGPEGWYAGTEEIDTAIRERFLDDWEAARAGAHGLWMTDPQGMLAYLILTDQFPRNMFRGGPQSFDTDPLARAAARTALNEGADLEIEVPVRQFFYLPFMHSEDLSDQDRTIELFTERMPNPGSLLHARAHRAVIARFGRFPTRNAALSRASTKAEEDWLAAGGYMAVVNALEAGKEPVFPGKG